MLSHPPIRFFPSITELAPSFSFKICWSHSGSMTPLFHFAVRSGEKPVTHSSFIICKQFINRLKESSEKQQSPGKVDLSNVHRHLTSYSNLNSPTDATKKLEKCRPSKQVKVESIYRKSGCVKQLLKSDKSKQEKISQCLAWVIDL